MTSAPSRPVTLGLVQQGSDLDPAKNMRRTVQGVREAAGRLLTYAKERDLMVEEVSALEETARQRAWASSTPCWGAIFVRPGR